MCGGVNKWMDGYMDGWVGGWVCGWMDGWVNGVRCLERRGDSFLGEFVNLAQE